MQSTSDVEPFATRHSRVALSEEILRRCSDKPSRDRTSSS